MGGDQEDNVRMRAETINEHLGVQRVVVELAPDGIWLVRYGQTFQRGFGRAWEAALFLEGFAAMIDSQGQPCPDPPPTADGTSAQLLENAPATCGACGACVFEGIQLSPGNKVRGLADDRIALVCACGAEISAVTA